MPAKTNSCYDISYINEKASIGEVYLKIRLFEGHYEDVTNEITGEVVNTFIRDVLLGEESVMFDYFAVPATDLHTVSKELLSQFSTLPIVPEQA